MNTIRISLLPWVIMGIGALQAKDCVYTTIPVIQREGGSIEYPEYGAWGGAIPAYQLEEGDVLRVARQGYGMTCEMCDPWILELSFNHGPVQVLSNASGLNLELTAPGIYWAMWWRNCNDASYPAMFIIGEVPQVSMELQMMLGGAYDQQMGLMRNALQQGDQLPSYAAGLGPWLPTIVSAGTLDSMPIVDWVGIFLRSASDPSLILTCKDALLRSDGHVIEMDGTTQLVLWAEPGEYFVSVHHRNHLGVMSASPIHLDSSSTVVDMTSATFQFYGSDPVKILDNKAVLWPGNVRLADTGPNVITYAGPNNDRDAILQRVGGATFTNTVTGYYDEDTNMDGVVKYAGTNNDSDVILQTIGGTVPTAVRVEQLP